MSLRQQLLMVSLLLLSIPWAGCQFLREIEQSLREGRENTAAATGAAVAAVITANPDWLHRATSTPAEPASLFAFPGAGAIELDGYDDEWPETAPVVTLPATDKAPKVTYKARLIHADQGSELHIHYKIYDDELIYHNPRVSWLGSGDRLVLATQMGSQHREVVLSTSVPGVLQAKYLNDAGGVFYEPRLQAYWQEFASGYMVELHLPVELAVSGFGFYFINQDRAATADSAVTTGNIEPDHRGPLPLPVISDPVLNEILAIFPEHPSISILDHQSRLLAGRAVYPAAGDNRYKTFPGYESAKSQTSGLGKLFYRSILRDDELPALPDIPATGIIHRHEVQAALRANFSRLNHQQYATQWYRQPASNSGSLLAVAVPIMIAGEAKAVVLVEQDSEQYLSLTDDAFGDLLFYSLFTMLTCSAGLLLYASALSFRIRRLSRAAREIIHADGRLRDNFPRSGAKDEIGDLTRSYGELLSQLRGYTEYLRTLSGKLSHELRTPIAVVASSLENLEEVQCTPIEEDYLKRARDGLNRLRHILTAMTEASNLAESIEKNPTSPLDLAIIVRELTHVHASLNPATHYLNHDLDSTAMINGNADLLQQLLDKLLDNAVDFCPVGGAIVVSINRAEAFITLEVCNDGPLLPSGMERQIFDSMVSMRAGSGGPPHLGLGLHIVQLIATFLNATVQAINRSDKSGVCFRIIFPRTPSTY